MTRKLERVFRDRRLTPDEIARDQDVRRKVEAEFPPASRKADLSGRLSAALREALRASNKTTDEIAHDAGVAPVVLSQFLIGERDIRMATADKLAEALGLSLAKAS
jgi:hypothetical protein